MDSDSDWDSLSGEAGPTSEPEPTPRNLQPTPPALSTNSPRHGNRRPLTQGGSSSKPSSPAINKAPSTAPSNRPSQIYGKSGPTSFVDKGMGVTKFSDTGLDSRKNIESPVLGNGKNKKKSVKGINNNGLELNDMDLSPATNQPPYTDFKDISSMGDTQQNASISEQKKSKKKDAYFRSQTPDYFKSDRANNSWDEPEASEGPGLISIRGMAESPLQPVAPPPSNHKQLSAGGVLGDVAVGAEKGIDGVETCCVPYQTTPGMGQQYIFYHGRNHLLDVSPEWREPYLDDIGERSERWMKYFWQEFFGALGLIVDFALIFVLELLRFLLRKVVLRVVSGVMTIFSDHLMKPSLSVTFNSFIQPLCVFTWNVFSAMRNAVSPLLDISREVSSQVAGLVRSFRLFELNWQPVINGDSALVSRQRIQEI
ncbi:predicted protein [Nematostella vectensis]|uniref:Uncharacterized protein n=1 Tax=Nematostella vectensis TaxID=45351 RepID=A7RS92_NEMVE|nr:predicted protein [Nematostella vectensis]|eukprot:XP_001637768.1 predicted protein [Nematostella vectensis]